VFASSGLGSEKDMPRVKRGRWMKNFEKHCPSVYFRQIKRLLLLEHFAIENILKILSRSF